MSGHIRIEGAQDIDSVRIDRHDGRVTGARWLGHDGWDVTARYTETPDDVVVLEVESGGDVWHLPRTTDLLRLIANGGTGDHVAEGAW